jgi:hypothetical protein
LSMSGFVPRIGQLSKRFQTKVVQHKYLKYKVVFPAEIAIKMLPRLRVYLQVFFDGARSVFNKLPDVFCHTKYQMQCGKLRYSPCLNARSMMEIFRLQQ